MAPLMNRFSRYPRTLIGAMLCTWLLAVSIGLKLLNGYAAVPGRPSAPPMTWPESSRLDRVPRQPVLLLFAHPQCPCTRATLEELDGIMAHVNGQVTAYVLFLRPPTASARWAESALYRKAARIPGVRIVVDNGAEAGRFHVATSGAAVLYDELGHLVFHGGITSARGHAGMNAGRATLQQSILRGAPGCESTAVFGCALPEIQCETP